MAITYIPIASVAVGLSGAANIEFTSIPGTYTDLCLVYSLRTNDNTLHYTDVSVTLNSTNVTNAKVAYGIGTTTGSYSPSAAQSFFAEAVGNTATASTFSNGQIYIPNYTATDDRILTSDVAAENNNVNGLLAFGSGNYTITSAVTSIKLTPASPHTFVQYSTAYLYGIKNTV